MVLKPYETLEDWIYIILRSGRVDWLGPDDAEDMAKDVTSFLFSRQLIKTAIVPELPGPQVSTPK
jgi:hypothetical protein